jgi:hypothetical protein
MVRRLFGADKVAFQFVKAGSNRLFFPARIYP